MTKHVTPFSLARFQAALTQRELGAAVGLSHVTIGEYDRGSWPREASLRGKLAEALGSSVEELFPNRH